MKKQWNYVEKRRKPENGRAVLGDTYLSREKRW